MRSYPDINLEMNQIRLLAASTTGEKISWISCSISSPPLVLTGDNDNGKDLLQMIMMMPFSDNEKTLKPQ